MTLREWRDRYVASFEEKQPEEAAFWRDELADPWAAQYWYDFEMENGGLSV